MEGKGREGKGRGFHLSANAVVPCRSSSGHPIDLLLLMNPDLLLFALSYSFLISGGGSDPRRVAGFFGKGREGAVARGRLCELVRIYI
jgi:hypothetical protein